MSRRHALFTWTKDGVTIYDDTSSHGTAVYRDGHHVSACRDAPYLVSCEQFTYSSSRSLRVTQLKNGDYIRFGKPVDNFKDGITYEPLKVLVSIVQQDTKPYASSIFSLSQEEVYLAEESDVKLVEASDNDPFDIESVAATDPEFDPFVTMPDSPAAPLIDPYVQDDDSLSSHNDDLDVEDAEADAVAARTHLADLKARWQAIAGAGKPGEQSDEGQEESDPSSDVFSADHHSNSESNSPISSVHDFPKDTDAQDITINKETIIVSTSAAKPWSADTITENTSRSYRPIKPLRFKFGKILSAKAAASPGTSTGTLAAEASSPNSFDKSTQVISDTLEEIPLHTQSVEDLPGTTAPSITAGDTTVPVNDFITVRERLQETLLQAEQLLKADAACATCKKRKAAEMEDDFEEMPERPLISLETNDEPSPAKRTTPFWKVAIIAGTSFLAGSVAAVAGLAMLPEDF